MDKVTIVDTAQIAASLAGGAAGWIMGGFDLLLKILVVVTILDVISGVCQAIYNKKLNSSVSYRGIIKKVGIFVLVAVMHMVDLYMGVNFLRDTVIGFFLFNEILSIIENWGKTGLAFPEQLKTFLAQLQTENMEKGEKNQLK